MSAGWRINIHRSRRRVASAFLRSILERAADGEQPVQRRISLPPYPHDVTHAQQILGEQRFVDHAILHLHQFGQWHQHPNRRLPKPRTGTANRDSSPICFSRGNWMRTGTGYLLLSVVQVGGVGTRAAATV